MTNEPGPNARVALLAEDDRDIRDLVSAKLASGGFEVLSYGDGVSALAALREHLPDVALLDVMMPGISGLDILEELQSDDKTARIPVILLSAKSREFDVETGFALGAVDYVVKPFSPRDLLARVNAVLERVVSAAEQP